MSAAKFWVALLIEGIGTAARVAGAPAWILLLSAGLTPFAVWATPNTPKDSPTTIPEKE